MAGVKIYEKNDVVTYHIPMDQAGIIPEKLEESGAEILHITPFHHFPTGIVMPVSRRYEFLSWASKGENRYIIEDDYDCEFRLAGRPIPTLQSIDVMEKVIYINTFSKSLAPAFRISYLVLPKHLVTRFYETLGFYSGTVSCLEQMTLGRFLSEGYYGKTHQPDAQPLLGTSGQALLSWPWQSPGGQGEDQRGACGPSFPAGAGHPAQRRGDSPGRPQAQDLRDLPSCPSIMLPPRTAVLMCW
ncbi:MAG: hypothetical protein ACLT9P_02505 [Evtepia gabavorous]